MNAAFKTRLSNIITIIVSIIPAIQTSLSSPPLSQENLVTYGGILAFASLSFTALKQWLSAEVNNAGAKVTLWVALATILAGLSNIIGLFHLTDAAKETINWWISLIAMIVNIGSKQIFPSVFQQQKNNELKTK